MRDGEEAWHSQRSCESGKKRAPMDATTALVRSAMDIRDWRVASQR